MLLKELTEIKGGHPFRGRIDACADDICAERHIKVLQTRDQDAEAGIDWAALIRADLPGRKSLDCLKPGEVVFSARGQRTLASVVPALASDTVCSQHFFRIATAEPLLPAFLAWQLNQPPAQRYFRKAAEGTAQVSIRRAVLEDAHITVPPLDVQRRIIAYYDAAARERQLLRQLIANRQRESTAIINRLFAGEHEFPQD